MLDSSFIAACLATGAVAGYLGGLLGIGGGVIIVPALILLFDLEGAFAGLAPNAVTLIAVGTSLASIVFTCASAAYAQIRAGMVEWRVVRLWTPFLVIGSYLAGFVAAELPPVLLRSLIATFLAFVAFVMLTNWRPSAHRRLPGLGPAALLASAGGLMSGIAGIGGGNVVVPTLVFFNTPMHRATATSSTLGLPIALAGAAGYVHRGWSSTAAVDGLLGYVYLPAALIIVLTTVLFAQLGVRAAHRLPPTPLRRVFGVLLVLVSGRMLASAFAS